LTAGAREVERTELGGDGGGDAELMADVAAGTFFDR
jgi:hypothetical protein